MQKSKSLSVLLIIVFVLGFSSVVWGLSGTVTDNRLSAGGSTIMIFAIPHQAQIDPYFVEIECLSQVTGTYPDYSFDLSCVTPGNYDIGVVDWDGSSDGPPTFAADLRLNVPFDTTGIALYIQPNADHISGDLYEWGTGNLVTQEAEIWAFDQSGNLVGIAFADNFGHYDFGYLPAGSGPYDLVAQAEGYWEETSTGVVNPLVESFILRKAVDVEITNSQNTGYNYDYNLHPERANWVLSDATNYTLTVMVAIGASSKGALPVEAVLFRLPGGAFSLSKFSADPSTSAHTVDPSLDWDSVYVDQSGVQDKVLFTQGKGSAVINASNSVRFTVQVTYMGNIPQDNYTDLEVMVFHNGGTRRASDEAELVQKILRIQDLSFYPDEVDASNQTGPGSYLTISAAVENHGTASFAPYQNWSGIWSAALVDPGISAMFDSVSPGSAAAVALFNAQVTGTQGNYEVSCYVSDSLDQNSSYLPFEESLEVISTGVEDQNEPGLVPKSFALSQNFPNPFNASTRIDYTLASGSSVTLEVFNLLGQKVTTLVSEYQSPGKKSVAWNGENQAGSQVPSGVYFYRLRTLQNNFTKKMVLIR